MYPVSSFSNDVDDKDPTLRKDKKAPKKKPEQQAPAQQAPVPEQPAMDLYAVPEGYDQAYAQYQQAMEMPVDDGYGYAPDQYSAEQQYYDPNGYNAGQGGNDNGYVE